MAKRTGVLAAALAISVLMSAGTAPTSSVVRPAAAAEPVRPEPTFEVLREQATVYFLTGNFAALEAHFAKLVADPVPLVSGKPKALAAYWAFRDLFADTRMPLSGHRESIERWRSTMPGSVWVSLVEARYWYAVAWAARGETYAHAVKVDAWEVFDENLEKAETVLRHAPEALKDTPLWYHLLLVVTQDLKRPTYDPDELVDVAVARWPQYYSFYEVRADRLQPKWGGSWDLLDAQVSEWSTALEKTDGTSLYARVYASLVRHELPARVIAARWPVLKASFNDLITRYPDPRFNANFASFACLVGDREQFQKLTAESPRNRYERADWLYGATPSDCRHLLEPTPSVLRLKKP